MGTGEGPYWEESTQSLLFIDVVMQYVRRWDYATKEVQEIKLDNSVGFAIPRKSGGIIVGLGKTVSHLNWETKEVTMVMELDKECETRMNDAKCDCRGRLWAGTMGIDRWPGMPHMGEGSLYCIDIDATVKKHKEKTNISNGLAWSSDNKIMYYIDSQPGTLWAYDYDVNTGSISNVRTVLDFDSEKYGAPDGMTIDTEGKLWVACYGGSCVVRLDPNTGEELQIVKFPARRITSCCFGGPNYDELFVTSAAAGADDDELKQYPLSGSLFRVTGLGVKGYPPNVYNG